MANNYQNNSSESFGGLIGASVSSGGIPAAGSDDAKLLRAQITAAGAVYTFIGAVKGVIRNGQDVTNDAQKFYLAKINQFPMTLSAAIGYFPSVSPYFWSAKDVIDWQAVLAVITSTPFPS
jgi:hypothetical protein